MPCFGTRAGCDDGERLQRHDGYYPVAALNTLPFEMIPNGEAEFRIKKIRTQTPPNVTTSNVILSVP